MNTKNSCSSDIGGTGNEDTVPLDYRAVYDAVSYALIHDEDGSLRSQGRPLVSPITQIVGLLPGQEKNEGNELSYTEAASFIAYLTDTYTFEAVIQMVCSPTPDFVSIFGKDYEMLRYEWIEFLRR